MQHRQEWKQHPQYPIKVSNWGRVRRLDGSKPAINLKARYLQVYISKIGWKKIHVLVLETFVGPRPEGMVVRHLNGCNIDNKLRNLAWGTSSQNAKDRSFHGVQNPPPIVAYTPERREYMRQVAYRRNRDSKGKFA